MTPDNIRIFKKLAESNKSLLSLKDIKVDGDKIQNIKNDSCSESDSETEDSTSLPIVFKSNKNKIIKDEIKNEKVNESDSESEKDDESEIESEKDDESESEIEKDIGSEIEIEKDIGSESEIDSDSDSEIDEMKSTMMTELSAKIDDMQTSIKNIESILSKF